MRKDQGWEILGSGMGSNEKNINDCKSYNNLNIENSQMPKLLLIGNEGFGIPTVLSELCNSWIYLQSGRNLDPDVDSLNVSVATALLINSLKCSI